MSLDVYLTMPTPVKKPASDGIFIRRNGMMIEITREEWDRWNPGIEPVSFFNNDEETNEVFKANITHNLNKMATEAGIYEALWRPEEIGITNALQLIPILEKGLALLQSDRERFVAFNPENGWGSYDAFVPWVKRYLDACRKWPDAKVEASR